MNPLVEKIGKIYIPGVGTFVNGEVVRVVKHNRIDNLGGDTGEVCESKTGVYVINGVSGKGVHYECSNANRLGVPQCCMRWDVLDQE